jgi:hypothetical protein
MQGAAAGRLRYDMRRLFGFAERFVGSKGMAAGRCRNSQAGRLRYKETTRCRVAGCF